MVATCIADFWGKKVDLNEYMHLCVLQPDARDQLTRLQHDDGILPPGDYEYKDLLNMKEHYCDMLGYNHTVNIAAIISPAQVTNMLFIRALAVECLLNWIEIERRTDTAEITYGDLDAGERGKGTSSDHVHCEMLKSESVIYMLRKRGRIDRQIRERYAHDECCVVM
jgi:hypothetical protein